MRSFKKFQTSFFFSLRKDIARTKTQIKPKPTKLSKQKTSKATIFAHENFWERKNWLVLVSFLSLYARNLFVNKINWFQIVLITSFTILLTYDVSAIWLVEKSVILVLLYFSFQFWQWPQQTFDFHVGKNREFD